jgi:hypothetical protein
MPTLSLNKDDLEIIVDALKCAMTKSQLQRAALLVERLTAPIPPPKGAGWAPFRPPIRSAWPSGITKKPRKQNPYFHKPRSKSVGAPQPKAKLSADDILSLI